MSGNLGETRFKRKRRANDPMEAYDALPEALRHWLAQAAMPWSPHSVRRVWAKSLARGKSPDEPLSMLTELEHKNLSRESASRR